MDSGLFKFEDCLLKHFIRKEVWLPRCKKRFNALKKSITRKAEQRRLKYFTFCAVGALDVIMLDLEKVIRRNQTTRKFDTIYFFDVNSDHVLETLKRIPGANGFTSDFVQAVLAPDPDESVIIDDPIVTNEPAEDSVTATDPLAAPETLTDTASVREDQRLKQTRIDFIRSFPFDVINLDLETYLFKPKEGIPGKVLNAFRKVFEWQRQKGKLQNGTRYAVNEFTLMFTTRVGPPNLGKDYLDMLQFYIEQNINRDATLKPVYFARSTNREPEAYLKEDFDAFFKLAVPKSIASVLWEEDWQINPESGIQVYEFKRETEVGSYQMLHFVMDVQRIVPPREQRPPAQMPIAAVQGYEAVMRTIFENLPFDVHGSLHAAGEEMIQNHLDKVKEHREKVHSV